MFTFHVLTTVRPGCPLGARPELNGGTQSCIESRRPAGPTLAGAERGESSGRAWPVPGGWPTQRPLQPFAKPSGGGEHFPDSVWAKRA